ncbi:DUF192 domain-containing protein [Bremerella cremea]|uniref:DUF192 domain-containing protein n=1 Tax=Bremerella cremea TaxID=1031537 RepID=UPI001314676B|nr:DUF192 domain-containing protein [Bremerella cremea]
MSSTVQLIDRETEEVVIPRLLLATSFWKRFCGLQGAAPLAPEEGLLLAPCRSIHTHFLRFSLDIFFCSAEGVVLSQHLDARPWLCIASNRQAHFVVETLAQYPPRLHVGQNVLLASDRKDFSANHRVLPPSLWRQTA